MALRYDTGSQSSRRSVIMMSNLAYYYCLHQPFAMEVDEQRHDQSMKGDNDARLRLNVEERLHLLGELEY
jgi:hypothetical protein